MRGDGMKVRVLVVEDEASARAALTSLLDEEGYEARAAANGEEALAALAGWTPDVVLTDVKMPKVDGLELMSRLRQRLPGVPVIVMTAFGSIDHAVETMHLGAADYLAKPVEIDRLMAALQRVQARAGAPLRVGELVAGRYRIEGKLGEGAMGAVYRATQLNLGRPVALKLLTVQREVPDARARLIREARVAAALRHPNAVQVFDVGEDRGRPYLAMELLDGHDLRVDVGDGAPPLAPARLLRIAGQIASVLVAAHRIGLVHRDLKPENVFLERFEGGERVRVLDFGVAFIADDPAESGRLTLEGMVIGTPFYIAPEQAAGRAVGPAADIYSFGCLLYEMATGEVPFTGSNVEVLAAHLSAPPRPPGELRAGLPAGLEALILAMLRKEPGRRPTAARALGQLQALEAAAGGAEGGVPPRIEAVNPEETTLRGELQASAVIGRRTELRSAALRVLLVGEVAPALALALVEKGIALERLMDASRQARGATCVLAAGASLTTIEPLVALGLPVLADVDAGDLDRSAALEALGVCASLVRPLGAEAVSAEVRRVAAADERATAMRSR